MKTPFLFTLLLATLWPHPASAWPGGGTLNLVSDAPYNVLQVTVNIPSYSASSTQTTTVTGTIEVLADIAPATGATTALTLTGGSIAMSNMHFVLNVIIIKAADVTTAGMAGTVYTPPPFPAPATPTATGGTFDAALHHLIINQGTIGGTAGFPTPSPVNVNFADSPIAGAGTGTGTVTVVPGTSSATHRTCQTTIVLPVDFTNTQNLNGTAVTVRVKGNVKALGNVLIPLSGDANGNGILDTWEITNFGNANPGSNEPDANADQDVLTNLMEYALNTNPLLPNATPLVTDFATVGATRYLRLTVPKNPAATNLTYTVEVSADLTPASWNAAQTLIEPGSPPNVLRVRDSVPVTSARQRFIRLKVGVNP